MTNDQYVIKVTVFTDTLIFTKMTKFTEIIQFVVKIVFLMEHAQIIKSVEIVGLLGSGNGDILSAMEQAFALCPNQNMCGRLQNYSTLWSDGYQEKYEKALQEQQKNNSEFLNSSCCKPCSCETDCIVKLNCCPDAKKIFSNDSSFENSSSVNVSCVFFFLSGFAPEGVTFPDLHLKEIRKCPYRETIIEKFKKCYFSPDTFEGRVRVYSQSADLFYKNKFCALCNNVHDYTR